MLGHCPDAQGAAAADNPPPMSAVFHQPSLARRIAPVFQGFDGFLAFAVFLLACAGMLTMYSSGFDHGTRFADHGRNMLLAGFIMFVVAQVPPQRLMFFAVPVYVAGRGAAGRGGAVRHHQEGRARAGSTWAW